MTATQKPKLLDVVRFKTPTSEPSAMFRTGTIVEMLGPESALVETSDESGVLRELVPVLMSDLETVWSGTESKTPYKNQDTAKSYFEEGLLLLQNGLRGAQEKFAKAFQLQPRLAGTLLNLTNTFAQRGEYDNALFLYLLIADLRPDYGLARENLAITHLNRGVDYARSGALERAISDFTAALAFASSESVAKLCRSNLAAFHTKMGLDHVRIRGFSEAIQFFLAALYVYPSPTTRRNYALGRVSWVASKEEKSYDVPPRDAFKEPMLMGLTYSECLNAYGSTLASLGRQSEGTKIIEHAIEEDPSNELASDNLRILSRQQLGEVVSPAMWGLLAVETQRAEYAG